ncbi:hypothetical protein LWI28_018307 [Acer negundo]|uniref:RNase H type-1 domain-containing protein n=1 Tax=Acer negundo TaxID=4023 RepID=A0AAD5JPE6_ACENE|nr:hypothetical protein LWI28_018307 [Acer negundo]
MCSNQNHAIGLKVKGQTPSTMVDRCWPHIGHTQLRNSFVHDGRFRDPDSVISLVRVLLKDFQDLQVLDQVDSLALVRPIPKWCPPPLNHFKLNIDVALGLSGAVGVGAVLRDHLGAVKDMFSLPRLGCFDVDVGELFAIREALFAARHVGFPVTLAETDSLIAASNIKNAFSSAFHQPLVADVLDVFPSLDFSSFLFVPRGGNQVAHALTKYSLTNLENKIRIGVCPYFVQHVVYADIQ